MTGGPVVLCAPSGTGKTTVSRALLERRDDLLFSVSATTRRPRPGERAGVDYFFVEREKFESMIAAGQFLEWAEVHGELYGTPSANQVAAAEAGKLLLLDIDVQGARQVKRSVPDTVTVFLLPPSFGELLKRLKRRGSEGSSDLRRRLETAKRELEAVDEFRYVVVNDRLEDTIDQVDSILGAERQASNRWGALVLELRRGIEAALSGREI